MAAERVSGLMLVGYPAGEVFANANSLFVSLEWYNKLGHLVGVLEAVPKASGGSNEATCGKPHMFRARRHSELVEPQ